MSLDRFCLALASAAGLLAAKPAHAQPAPRYVSITSPDQLPPGARVVYVDEQGRPLAPTPAPYEPPARPLHPSRVGLSLVIGGVAMLDSAFDRLASAWGYGGFHSRIEFSLEGGVNVTPWLLFGLRVGYGNAGGGASASDQASMGLQTFDVGAIGRIGPVVQLGRGWMMQPAAQVEIGGMGGWISLRDEGQSTLMARIGGTAVLLFAGQYVGFSVRAGYHHANWADAGGAGVDLDVSGVHLGLGLEVRL